MKVTFPAESKEYRAARDRLLEREIGLRREMEAIAVERRKLPPGGVVPEDYAFQGAGPDGAPTDVRLSELFTPGRDSLAIYSFMFPRTYRGDRPGPSRGKTALLPLEEGPARRAWLLHRRMPDRIPATSAPSNRSGTCSI